MRHVARASGRSRWGLAAACLLAGCAASSGGSVRPGDLPQHVISEPFDLGWRVMPRGGRVRAEGLVQPRVESVRTVTLQLVGEDSEGRVVSFSTPAVVRWDSGSAPRSFGVELQPTGQNDHFTVRGLDWEYQDIRVK